MATRESREAARPSIEDIAKAAGVHNSTVSRAFRHPDLVLPSTRAHILAVARELGYQPNPVAQALVTGTSKLGALVVPDITNPLYGVLARAAETAARRHGYHLILCDSRGDADEELAYIRSMRDLYTSFAVLFARHERPDALRELVGPLRIAVISDEATFDRGPNVVYDNGQGMQLAVGHLLELGHRSIAMTAGPSWSHAARVRQERFQEAVRDASLEPTVLAGDWTVESGRASASAFLQHTPRPTAVIASNDLAAIGLMMGLLDAGVSVPEDVSVVGFDGLPLGADLRPALTSVRIPIPEMGEAAVEAAIKAIDMDDHGASLPPVELSCELLERASTARPPSR